MKWLNLQTTHCNLTEKCLKWQTSCNLKKLLTAVSTSVSAAAAFIQTRRQQFLKNVKWLNLQASHCNLTEKCLEWQTSFDFWQNLLTTVFTSVSAATAFTRGQQFLKKMTNDWIYNFRIAIWQKFLSIAKLLVNSYKKSRMTESTNFTLQFDRKLSQMTNFLQFFTKVTYCCVHFRFRCYCFYPNP